MTRMDVLDALLADADALLLEADDQTITESLERGEAPDARPDAGCLWCGHQFHGLGCYPPRDWLFTAASEFTLDPIDDAALPLTEVADDGWPCRCESALVPIDDTWRPIGSGDATAKAAHDATWLMHRTGMDGWAATAELERRPAWLPPDTVELITPGRIIAGWGLVLSPGVLLMGPGPSPDALARVGTALAEFGDAIVLAVGRALPTVPVVPFGDAMHTEIARRLEQLEPSDTDVVTEETPAARALRIRQTRHTGPERPTAERARRPRQHR